MPGDLGVCVAAPSDSIVSVFRQVADLTVAGSTPSDLIIEGEIGSDTQSFPSSSLIR